MKTTTNTISAEDFEYVSIVPEYDELGYESERIAFITAIADNGDCYEIAGMIIEEERTCYPFFTYRFVQVDEDGNEAWLGKIELDVRGMDEEDINAEIAAYLINRNDCEVFAC